MRNRSQSLGAEANKTKYSGCDATPANSRSLKMFATVNNDMFSCFFPVNLDRRDCKQL